MNSALSDVPVLRPDEKLSKLDWPSTRAIDVPSIGRKDCLLICAGFEDRAIETVRRISETQRAEFALGVINYLPEQEENRTEELNGIFRKANFHTVEKFIYNREKPSGIGEGLRYFLRSFNRTFIDISGMSRLLIVQILVALIAERNLPISIIYGEPKEYLPLQIDFEQDYENDSGVSFPNYISSGIFEIAATPELSSTSMSGEAIRLIAFPSFDSTQLANLLQELQPTYVDLIYAIPPTERNKWRVEAVRKINSQSLGEINKKANHTVSALDYRETLKTLFQIYAKRSMFDRLVLAPTGSKMQAVAIGLFRAILDDVQIVYPTPQTFLKPDKYTVGLRQLYQLDLPVEAISAAINDAGDTDSSQASQWPPGIMSP